MIEHAGLQGDWMSRQAVKGDEIRAGCPVEGTSYRRDGRGRILDKLQGERAGWLAEEGVGRAETGKRRAWRGRDREGAFAATGWLTRRQERGVQEPTVSLACPTTHRTRVSRRRHCPVSCLHASTYLHDQALPRPSHNTKRAACVPFSTLAHSTPLEKQWKPTA